MTYSNVVGNAMTMLEEVGVEVDIDDLPSILVEEELCTNFSLHIGEEEAQELQRQLVIADIRGQG